MKSWKSQIFSRVHDPTVIAHIFNQTFVYLVHLYRTTRTIMTSINKDYNNDDDEYLQETFELIH